MATLEMEVLTQVVRMLFFTFILLSVFLLIGTFIRAKVKWTQKLFLPASVIGGFVGLLLGPIVLKDYALVPIPDDWITIASLLPGLLIVPVVASVPLGLSFGTDSDGSKSNLRPMWIMFMLLAIVGAVQNLTSLSIAAIFKKFFNYTSIYPTFGTEVSAGFAGGHGTAGVVGSLLQSMDQPYWDVAQGITTTTATVGLISGILIGILLINIAARKGYTKYIKTDVGLPESMKTGIQKDEEQRDVAGLETTNSSSLDSMAFHLALILTVSGMAFGLAYFFKANNILILNMIPEWAYAILLMYLVWGLMVKFKLAWIVDVKTKTKIASTLTEFAIVAAIISLPIQAVFAYILPLVTMMVITLLITILIAYFLSKLVFDDFWFERSVSIIGTNMGVFLTGLLLLRMVDPDMKSPVLRDYSLAYSFNSVIGFILFPLSFSLLINQGLASGLALYAGFTLFFIALLYFVLRKSKRSA